MQQLTIIGGGAAGFFCAVNAARLCPQLKVTILEKSSRLLSKVKVSGGGRCNVTHHCFEVEELIKKYPRGKHFLKKELYRFTPKDTMQWFEDRGVKLKAEADGRVFPVSNSSQTIIDCLLNEAKKHNVEILTNIAVQKIEHSDDIFYLHTQKHILQADYVCVATGGFAKTEQFDWLKPLQHNILSPVPSLFTFNVSDNKIVALTGISIPDVQLKIAGTKLSESGALLITHWGFSGPAALRLSAWGARILAEKKYHFTLQINWTQCFNDSSLREKWNEYRTLFSTQKAGSKNPFALPARLWYFLLLRAGINTDTAWNALSSARQNRLMQLLTCDTYEIKGKTTFKEEFVTCGGIALNEINPQTMESRLHKNLFFAGEIMDIDGITGGFNFQHAWASGMVAAISISTK